MACGLPFAIFPIKHKRPFMKAHGIIIILMIAGLTKVFGAGDIRVTGSRAAGMGGISVAITDLWSLQNNPAGAAWLNNFTAGISFDNRFLLKETCNAVADVALPMKAGTFGIGISRYGSTLYNETRVGLSFARKFGKHFSAGVTIDYQRIGLTELYGSRNLFSFEVGLLFRSGGNLTVGLHLVNPVPVTILTASGEKLPTALRIGISHQFSPALLAGIEIEKDLSFKPIIRAGGEYRFIKPAAVRIGMSTNPMLFNFGFGIQLGGLQIDIATEYHLVLGFSPNASLVWSFKQQKK